MGNNTNDFEKSKKIYTNDKSEENYKVLHHNDKVIDTYDEIHTLVEEVESCKEINIYKDIYNDNYEKNFEKESYNHEINYTSNKSKKKIKKSLSKVTVIALIVGLLGGIIGGAGSYYVMKKYVNASSNNNVVTNIQTFRTESKALTVSKAFEKVAPAVVIISASGVIDYSGIIPKETSKIGSGFIINEEGYILTNYHIFKGAKEVVVTLSDGRDVNAKVVNYDENQDVAMLKISDDTVKVPAVVELGNSDALKPGEQVIAIGSPLSKEFGQTVTAGIVSATNRTLETSSGVQLNLIQTDTAINPGNSGGPLVNMKGEIIGINNLKIASDKIDGLGFSIPINSVKDRIETLSKPILNLGISVREITPEISKEYEIDEGLYIVQVTEFYPAEKAGLQSKDLIVKFDSKRIKTLDELKAIRDTKKEGDIVSVEVIRNGETKTFNIELEGNS